MRYLRNSDYKYAITQYDFETLTFQDTNSSLFVLDAEIKAQDIISLYLRKRYVLTDLFATFPDYHSGTSYGTGDTVWYGGGFDALLYSLKRTTNDLPTGNTWELVESRYPSIIQWMVNISLFLLHQRISPDNIPVHRVSAYQETMMFLKGIQAETLSPDFPEVENRNYHISISGRTSGGIEVLW